MPIIHVSRLFLFAPSTSALKPNKLADATPLNLDGVRYLMSSTEDILSPYFASNPPVEKSTPSVISTFTKLNPSCWPERVRNGR